ncbi:MAG: HAD family hydrolase [Deltaproteobacteria bacterium]|nr:MAG: HAD family hydrolase [Deltaproteobacteria bacterium]
MTFTRSKLTVDAVIFDLDGTLIDSIGIYYEIIDIVFQRLELPLVSNTQIVEAVKDGDFDWDVVLPENMLNRKDEIITDARKIIDEIYPQMFGKDLKLIPGAPEALKEISCSGMKIGIVTSTPAQGMAYKLKPLKSNGIEKLLEVIITADDVHEKKPAPEPLVECAKRLGMDYNKSVYVGDTRVDIRAGKAAGMKTIGVLTGFDDYESLKNEKPNAIINSIAELRKTIAI